MLGLKTSRDKKKDLKKTAPRREGIGQGAGWSRRKERRGEMVAASKRRKKVEEGEEGAQVLKKAKKGPVL
jgi:hypothetical protein